MISASFMSLKWKKKWEKNVIWTLKSVDGWDFLLIDVEAPFEYFRDQLLLLK